MGNTIKSASDEDPEATKALHEPTPTNNTSSNYQDDLKSYKSFLSQHQILDQIQFRSLPDKFCTVRIVIMQSGMNGNTLMYDTHHDNHYKQFRAKLNQNTKEVNERFRKMQLLKSTTVASRLKTSSPSLKPLLSVLSSSNLNLHSQPQQSSQQPLTTNSQKNNSKQPIGMNDTSILGEILFGAIPIQILGQNTKIHTLPQHKQTCLSKVFRVGLPISAVIKTDLQSENGDDSITTPKDVTGNVADNAPSTNSSPISGSLVRNRAISIVQQPNPNQISATAFSPNTIGTRNRSYSTSVTDALRDTTTTPNDMKATEDSKPQKKKDRKKKSTKDQDMSFMCKSSFGIAVLLVFHDCGEDKDELQNPNQLQRLIFSHFPIFEHKLRKLLNSCKNSIQAYLKTKVDEARESDRLDDIFSGFTFNIRSFHGCLQDSEEISNASIDFNKFLVSFLHAPRFNEPIWQSQSLIPFEKSNQFSTFLNDLTLLTQNDQQNTGFISLVLSTILSNHLSWVAQFVKQPVTTCSNNPSTLIQKYLKSVYGSGYLPTISTSQQSIENPDPNWKGLKKFCKIIVVGSNNRDIRYCISMITFLLQTTLLLEKEYSVDKPQPSSNNLSQESKLTESLVTLTPMQFIEMKPPLKTKPKLKNSTQDTNNNKIFHTIESDSDEDSEYHIKPVVLVPKPKFSSAPYDNEVEEMNLKMKFNKFGNSLFADVCTWYCGGFVISGLPRYVNFQKELIEDLDFIQTESIDGDPRLPDVASCIIVDIEGKSCNVVTSKHKSAKFEEGHNSSIISKMLNEILFLKSLDGKSNENDKACEQLFKDTLYSLVLKTKLLLSIVDSIDSDNKLTTSSGIHWRSDSRQTPTKKFSEQLKKILVAKPKKEGTELLTYEQLAPLLHVNITDVPLLISIASAFRNDISKKVIPHRVSKKKKR